MFLTRRLIARPFLRCATPSTTIIYRRYASSGTPNLSEMMNDPKIRDTFEKLSRHPPAIVAMQKIGDIVKAKGFQADQPPSKMDMIKLMMDKEFRDAAQTLTTEMQNAGVEINPDVFMKIMESTKGN